MWQVGVRGGGGAWQGVCVGGERATTADGTHPTGMHTCSHCNGNSIIFIILLLLPCHHEWVQYSFMMATATEKMGIMVTNWSVHIVTQQYMEMFEKTCNCRRSVNEP